MKFPKVIKHRKAEVTIYGKRKSYPFYRLAYRINGKRVMKSFTTYGEAKVDAKKTARELHKGNQSLALTTKEVTGALAIRDTLDAYKRETGRSVTALQAVSQYVHSAKRLGDRPMGEAIEDYLRTVAVVRRKLLSEAVAEFVATRAPKAIAIDGKRPVLNPKYVQNTANWLQKFAEAFRGSEVGDLTKEHLNAYMTAHSDLSAKSRNDRRAVVKLFLKWCVRNDYLTANNRLLEADGLAMEVSDTGAIDYYRPAELRLLLGKAGAQMRIVIALQGLAGLRLEEALRLTHQEVFGIPGHVEVSSSKSKTRQRRLVAICPALEQWLAPYRGKEGKVAPQWETVNGYVQAFMALRRELGIPARKNGLRHAFVSYHFALHQNENVTSALAGTSPGLIHGHYKGLATKAEAKKWFRVKPARSPKVVILKKAANQ